MDCEEKLGYIFSALCNLDGSSKITELSTKLDTVIENQNTIKNALILNNVSKIDTVIENQNTIKNALIDSEVSKIDTILESLKDSEGNLKLDTIASNSSTLLADIHLALGINPPDTDFQSLSKYLQLRLGFPISVDEAPAFSNLLLKIKNHIDSKNYSPTISTNVTSTNIQAFASSLTNDQGSGILDAKFIGIVEKIVDVMSFLMYDLDKNRVEDIHNKVSSLAREIGV